MDYLQRYVSPLGGITLASDGARLTGLWFDAQRHFGATLRDPVEQSVPVLEQAVHWLEVYFSEGPPDFTPPLSLAGTAFQRTVWELLLEIPYGQTVTYGELARRAAERLGLARMSAQAVGGAVGRNPISVIVPCHRVIGTNGSLTGYAGGLERKRWLLAHEGAAVGSFRLI